MPKKLREMDDFPGLKLLLQVQERGKELAGGPVDGLVATVLGLVEHMVKEGILKDPE